MICTGTDTMSTISDSQLSLRDTYPRQTSTRFIEVFLPIKCGIFEKLSTAVVTFLVLNTTFLSLLYTRLDL